jgi:phage terminase large subunit-like protein
VFLVRGGWNRPFIDEHAAFPDGNYDDQVDICSWGFNKLMELANKPKRESRIY